MIRPPRRLFQAIGLTVALAFLPQVTAADELQRVQGWRGSGFAGLSQQYDALCVPGSKARMPASRFPIASDTAFITRCQSASGSGFDRLALLVDDGLIKVVEITFGPRDIPAASEQAGKMMDYAGYSLLPAEAVATSKAQKRTMFLSPEALHSHVFLNSLTRWENRTDRDPAGWLKGIELGAPLETFQKGAPTACEHSDWRQQDPAQWGWPHHTMSQLDCFGPEFMGAKRKFELVFADGKLKYAWVLLARQELDRVTLALKPLYGALRPVSPDLDRIGGSSLYLRRDKPELLLADRNTVHQIMGN